MKLVGATNWFVRGPFMLEGVLTGLADRSRRWSCSSRGDRGSANLGQIQNDPDVRALAFTWTAVLVLVGLGIGALGSGLTLRRFLRV